MNNKSIKILRGGVNYEVETSNEILLDGQPFYSKKNKQLYIGDGTSELKDLSPVGAGNLYSNTLINDNKEPGKLNYSVESIRAIDATNGYKGATGLNSFAFGLKLDVAGESAVAFGEKNLSNNNQTFASGQGNHALGKYSFAAGGGNNKVLGDYGFVSGSKNVSLGIKNFTTGSYNFGGGTASSLSGEFNNEAYFALDLYNQKLIKSYVNPLNTNNNIFDSEKSEVIGKTTSQRVTNWDDYGPDCHIEHSGALPTGITGTIEGGYPDSDLTSVSLNIKNIDWTHYEEASRATIKTEEGYYIDLVYYPNEEYIELSCRDFFAGILGLNLTLHFVERIALLGSIKHDPIVASFNIGSTTYYFGKDYYGNMIVGTGTTYVQDKDGVTVAQVVRPEKARCYKYSEDVYLFSLELDDYIPYNNIIGGDSNSINLGSSNILSGSHNKLGNGSNNILSGSYNTITKGSQNIVNGYNNIVKGNSNLAIGDNNTFTIDNVQGGATIGIGLEINRTNQVFIGEYNKPNESILFGVGNGSSDNRQNAFTVHQSGAVTVKKVPETNFEVLRLEDFVPNSNGNVSTKDGFDIKAKSFTIASNGSNLADLIPTSTSGDRKMSYITDGKIAWYSVSGDVKSNAIVKRNGSQIKVTTPKANNDATSKQYVDEADKKLEDKITLVSNNVKSIDSKVTSKLDKEVRNFTWFPALRYEGYGVPEASFDVVDDNEYKYPTYIKGYITIMTDFSEDSEFYDYSFEVKYSKTDGVVVELDDNYSLRFGPADTYVGWDDKYYTSITAYIDYKDTWGGFYSHTVDYTFDSPKLVTNLIKENTNSINENANRIKALETKEVIVNVDDKLDKDIVLSSVWEDLENDVMSGASSSVCFGKANLYFDKPRKLKGKIRIISNVYVSSYPDITFDLDTEWKDIIKVNDTISLKLSYNYQSSYISRGSEIKIEVVGGGMIDGSSTLSITIDDTVGVLDVINSNTNRITTLEENGGGNVGEIEEALDEILKLQDDLMSNIEIEEQVNAIIEYQQNIIGGGTQ